MQINPFNPVIYVCNFRLMIQFCPPHAIFASVCFVALCKCSYFSKLFLFCSWFSSLFPPKICKQFSALQIVFCWMWSHEMNTLDFNVLQSFLLIVWKMPTFPFHIDQICTTVFDTSFSYSCTRLKEHFTLQTDSEIKQKIAFDGLEMINWNTLRMHNRSATTNSASIVDTSITDTNYRFSCSTSFWSMQHLKFIRK